MRKLYLYLVLCFSATQIFAQTSPLTHNICETTPPTTNGCSFTTLNKGCTLVVDRTRPVAPLPVYLKSGSIVTVQVINATPLESLSFDIVSSSAVQKPDPYSSIMTAVSPNLGKLEVAYKANLPVDILASDSDKQFFAAVSGIKKSAKALLVVQSQLIDEIDASLVLAQIKLALTPLSPVSCEAADIVRDDQFHNPWFETKTWKAEVLARLQVALQGTKLKAKDLSDASSKLDSEISSLSESLKKLLPPAQDDKYTKVLKETDTLLDELKQRQKRIPGEITLRGDAGDQNKESSRLATLIDGLMALPDTTGTITLQSNATNVSKDFNISESRAINYVNLLAPAGARASAETFKQDTPYLELAEFPSKTQLVPVSLQYQGKQWIEISSGLLVPFRAYHSYKSAAVAVSGTVTDNVVQETKTHTLVPAALVGVNLAERPLNGNPVALLLTGAVGINPVTSAVEFGIGPSISWKSIELSVLADYGSDTSLSGGFSVGQSLGLSSPPSPLTKTGYGWRGTAGFSVRIPIGGSGSTAASSGGGK